MSTFTICAVVVSWLWGIGLGFAIGRRAMSRAHRVYHVTNVRDVLTQHERRDW